VQHIDERKAHEVIADRLVEPLPKRIGAACGGVFAVLTRLEAGDRRKRSFGQTQDIIDRVVLRRLGQTVAAAFSAQRVEHPGFAQN